MENTRKILHFAFYYDILEFWIVNLLDVRNRNFLWNLIIYLWQHVKFLRCPTLREVVFITLEIFSVTGINISFANSSCY